MTAEAVRRGADDPLNRWDGTRWRRLFVVESHPCLLEVHAVRPRLRVEDGGPRHNATRGLVLRRLSGTAPPDLVRRVVTRIFGLDDPGPALGHRLSPSVRRLIGSHMGTLLPGHPTFFEALIQTVFGQHVHVRVANAQRAAFIRAFGERREYHHQLYWAFPDAERVADVRLSQIRRLGVTGGKAGAIRGIARTLAEGRLSEDRLAALPAPEVITALTALPGVGRWTSEWVLLRALRRFDAMPAGDLSIRKAVTWALGAAALLTEEQVREATAAWFPYAGLIAHRLLIAFRQSTV
jgi:3-methyladenine DNA glycosylase/8-oxoguanine DNA glycosylase